MKKDIQTSIAIYQEQLQYGHIQTAYITLTKYVAELKGKLSNTYSTSNIGFGYLDYTYFYFTNDYVKNKNLKFALVLNHKKMQFELWLCAKTANVQRHYWNLLKDSEWNKNGEEMPKYSILEIVLENHIDFHDKESMTNNIIGRSLSLSSEIQEYVRHIDCESEMKGINLER